MCFVYSVLADIHRKKDHSYRAKQYEKHVKELNLDGLTFPLPLNQIPKFEKLNPTISVSVLTLDSEGLVVPLLPTKHRDRKHDVVLLLISETIKIDALGNIEIVTDTCHDDNAVINVRSHYVWVKNLSRLLASRSNHKRKAANFACIDSLESRR